MSINESQEFEAINSRSREATAHKQAVIDNSEKLYRAKKVKETQKAIASMIMTAFMLVIALAGISLLQQIGWINGTFRVVLVSMAGYVAMFAEGYLWHGIKN